MESYLLPGKSTRPKQLDKLFFEPCMIWEFKSLESPLPFRILRCCLLDYEKYYYCFIRVEQKHNRNTITPPLNRYTLLGNKKKTLKKPCITSNKNWLKKTCRPQAITTQQYKGKVFINTNWKLVFWAPNVPVKSKLQHPPRQPPGHLNFWNIFVQIPPSPGRKAVQMPPPPGKLPDYCFNCSEAVYVNMVY